MSFEYTNKWQVVENTVSNRTLDDSLLHTLSPVKKIKKQTKVLNQKVKQTHNYVRSYKHFLSLKRQVERAFQDGDETDDEPGLTYEEYKKIHNEVRRKYQSQNLLQSGTQKKTCEYSGRTKQTSPTHNFDEKPSKSQNGKRPNHWTIPKSSDPKYGIKSTEKTSISLSDNGQSKLLNTRRIIRSFNENNVSQTNIVGKDNNEKEKNCIDRIIRDLISGNVDKQSTHEALESDSEKVEVTSVKDGSMVENLSAELTTSEPEYDATNNSRISLDNGSVVSNDQKQESCNLITDVARDLKESDSVSSSEEISNKDNCLSQEDVFITDDKTLCLKRDLSTENNDKQCMDNSNHDSGNNSLSDTDVSRAEYGKNSNDKLTPYKYEHHDVEPVTERCRSIKKEKSIASDIILGLEKNVNKFNGAESSMGIDEELLEKGELTDGNSNSESSKEVKPSIESAANHSGSKLIIRTIEHCDKGYEIFSKRQLLDVKTLKTVNNLDHKSLEKDLSSGDEQPMDTRKSSKDCRSSHNELQYFNELLDHRDSLQLLQSTQEDFNSSISTEILVEAEEQVEGNESSRENNTLEIEPRVLNRSLSGSFSSFSARSYDEELKNCVKTQLISEIEQRLRDTPSSTKNRSSHNCSQISNESLRDEAEESLLRFNSDEEDVEEESMDNQSLKEDNAQPLEDIESDAESSSLIIKASSSYRSSDVEDSLLSPKPLMPTKRRNSNDVTDHCSLDNTPRSSKLPRLHEAATNRHLELNSRGCKPPEVVSQRLQPEKNRKNSHDQDKQELNTSRNSHHAPKRKPRPRNLDSFVETETLTQDTTKPHFRLNDIGDDDEVWIMDIPRTIDPRDLENQMILLGGKSELKFGDDYYRVSSKSAKKVCNVSCIFATSRKKKQYKIANVESKGTIKFRQQFSVDPETKLISRQVAAVPFPKYLKIRHPLFGAAYEDKI